MIREVHTREVRGAMSVWGDYMGNGWVSCINLLYSEVDMFTCEFMHEGL